MNDTKYSNIVREKVEKGYDIIMPITGVVLFISAFIMYFSDISVAFAIADLIAGIALIIISIFKKRVNIQAKVIVGIIIAFAIGISAFLSDAFNSAGNIIILIGNLIAIVLLSKKKSIVISISSIFIFISLWIITRIYMIERFYYIKVGEWAIHFVVFVLFILIMHVLVFIIREYLISNLMKVEKIGEEVYSLAFYDELTGLPNQHLFRKNLIDKEDEKINLGYILMYKIRNLDVLNSIYGEETGNQILIKVSDIFSSLKRRNDLLARNSGNEFVFWIENLSQNELRKWISNTAEVFNSKSIIDNEIIKLEFYISYAVYKVDDKEIEDCYRRAGLALTCAKADNINDIVVYNKSFEENLYQEEVFKELLWVAIDKKEFEIYYQPKVNALTGKTVGVEALARWNSELLGTIRPDVFIPLIEKANQSISFGELIISKAFNDYRLLCIKYNRDIQLSINISPSHLMAKGFVEYLLKEVNHYNIEPRNIVIEITEDVLIKSESVVNKVLAEIRKHGVSVSLDDFGTGYSSYNYLMKLEIDELKIDKLFIDQLCEVKKARIMLESIIYISKNYNLKLVAEGVESKEQRDKLVELGCNIIQGYYYAKPEPLLID